MNLIDRLRSVMDRRKNPPETGSAGLALDRPDRGATEAGFAIALFRELGPPPGNLLLSPLSIRMALGMALGGAAGDTAGQIRSVLGASPSDEVFLAEVAALRGRLAAARGPGCDLIMENSLWSQEGAPLRDEFLESVSRLDVGSTRNADFRRNPEAARSAINRWVDQSTRGRIRDLIPPGGVNRETRLALVNAVFFKGRWRNRFEEDLTRDEAFHLEDGGIRETPLMRQQALIGYVERGHYQAAELAYDDSELSMLVLLPGPSLKLREFESQLDARELANCVAALSPHKVQIFLPSFEFTWGTQDLTGGLRSLGMVDAFDEARADFSGINGCRPPHRDTLFVTGVFHKAFVSVSEEGTEASAATAMIQTRDVSIQDSVRRAPIFRADRPFLFLIRDWGSGAILFWGRVADPTQPA